MKKGILLLIGLMTIATVNANINTSANKIGVNYRYNDAVTFIERGVQFHVFLNGDFDFDTHCDEPRYVDYYGRRGRVNNGVRIERDYDGRVRRVGNTFINYDFRGNVKRIGSVYMQYRFGQLTQVGNLEISYDRYGYPHFYGNVKYSRYYNDDFYDNGGFSIDINIGGDVCDYDDVYFYRREFRDNYRQFKEDDNYYYYRAQPDAQIGNRSKLLKRRKPVQNNSRKYRTYQKREKRDFTLDHQDRTTPAPTRSYRSEKREYKNKSNRDFSLENTKEKTRSNKTVRTPKETPTRSRRR